MRYLDRALEPEDTPANWLIAHLADATAFYAQVGYLDRGGISLIQTGLVDVLERGGQVHVVVDSRNGQPRRADISWVLDLFAPYGDRATLSLVRDASVMHTKVFAIHYPNGERRALVGSANLTIAGLAKNWEAGICVDTDATDILDAVSASIRQWQEHSSTVKMDRGVLASLVEPAPAGSSILLVDGLESALNNIEAANSGTPTGIPTGFSELDSLLNGLKPGELVLIAGRPSMGKSTLALDVLRNAAIRRNFPSLMMSFEMTRDELINRILSAEARVPLHILRSGQLSNDDWTKLARCMGEISEVPLYINDTCSPSIRHVTEEARRSVTEDGVRLIVIDYVQQLHLDRRSDSRQHEIAEISRSLKHLARELQVPLLVVSQLNRGSESRTDKRPFISDLRDSGALEQDADVVILLHRDDYYDKETPRAGEADFILAKQRNGPTDTVTVAAQLHLSRFVDMAPYSVHPSTPPAPNSRVPS
ncbi:DnaB-like helicase C-terminal domain-containing protein [Micromonospora sp. NPDC053740]|uniref:DnaB-like helicase C-terminal domain-containing protein n=1 Tax=Micromonospora sp. NPDC053740 TaxID=3155173 RepID=UPI0034154B03